MYLKIITKLILKSNAKLYIPCWEKATLARTKRDERIQTTTTLWITNLFITMIILECKYEFTLIFNVSKPVCMHHCKGHSNIK